MANRKTVKKKKQTSKQKAFAQAITDQLITQSKVLHSMLNGFALHEVITDKKGKPIDYVFIEINKAFEDLTGLKRKNLIGKRVSEALPGTEKDPADWIGKYGKVALTGKEIRFENYSEALDRYYYVYAFSPQKGFFVTIFEDITFKKKAEKLQKVEKQRLHDLLHGLPGFVYLQAPDHTIPFANKYFIDQFGKPKNKKCYQVLWKRNRPCEHCNTFKVFKNKKPQRWEWKETPNGKIYEVNDYPYYDQEGKLLVLELGIDITARKKQEQEHKKQEERFKAILNLAHVGIAMADIKRKKIIFANDYLCKLLGYRKKEILSLAIKDLHPAESVAKVMKIVSAQLKGVKIDSTYIPVLRKNKKIIYCNINSAPYVIEGKKVLLGAFTDVTEKKHAVDLVAERERTFRAIFNSPMVGMFIWKVDGKILHANRAFLKMLGYARRDLEAGKIDWRKITPPGHEEADAKAVRDVTKTGVVVPFEKQYLKKNKTPIDILIGGALISKQEGTGVSYIIDITEKKRAEKIQAEQEYLLAKAQEIGKIGSWQLDIVNNNLKWSKQNFINFGLKEGTKLTYEVFLNQVHPEDRKYVNREWKAALKGKPYEVEHRIVANKQTKWVWQKADLTFNKKGKAIYAIGSTQDITQRKLAEQELLKAKEKAETYLNIANVMIVGINPKKEVIVMNKKGAEILGYPIDQVIGKNFFTNFLPKRIQKEILKVSDKLFAGDIKPVEYYENPIVNSKGEEKLIAWSNSVLRDGKGKIIAHLSSGTDITERKEFEDKIADLARFPEENINPVLRIDSTGKLLYANKGSKQILKDWGYAKTQKLPKPILTKIKKALSLNKNTVFEINATSKIFELVVVPIKHRKYANVYGRDVTLTKRAEAAAKQLIVAQTEARVQKQRSEELKQAYEKLKNTQNQLIQVEKLASIGELGAGIAHELNSPLAGVLSLVRTTRNEKQPGTEEYEDLNDIEKACEYMAKVIRDLSEFSRRSTGQKTKTSIQEILSSTFTLAAHRIKKGNIKINQNIAFSPELLVDKSQIQQVFLNIINNACDAVHNKGTITITSKKTKQEGKDAVEIIFKDNGCGIKKGKERKIFDPFYTTKRPGKGIGLGMSIVHKIVTNHHGNIFAKNNPGKGASIHVVLPIA